MLEAAGPRERFIDGRQLVPVLIKSGANGIEVAKRGKEPERARKQAFAPKQLQQPSGAGFDDALAHRWRHDRAGVDQQLCARRTGEDPFSVRVEAVAIGARGDSQQATVTLVAFPGKERRVLRQQLLQTFDVVVVNEASGLRRRPLQTVAEALAHFRGEVRPAWVAVLTRDHELSVALRQGQVHLRQLRPRTGNRIGVTSGDVARELLCLLTEGFE